MLLGRQGFDASVQIADAVVQVEADLGQHVSVLGQRVFIELGNDLAKHDRVGDLHHGRFQVNRQQHALSLGAFDFSSDERTQGVFAHHRAVENLASLNGSLFFQDGSGTVLGDQLDFHSVSGVDQGSFFAAVEIAGAHVSDVGFGVFGPGAHFVRVLARIVLDRQRCTTIGVAFAQNRVHGAALDLVVTRLGVFVGVAGHGFRVVRQVVTLSLQLFDRGLQLWNRSTDVRQLDDVGFRRNGQVAQFGEVVGYGFDTQLLGEAGQNARCKRDIAGFHGDIGRGGVGLNDRQQGIGGEGWGFVGEGIDDLRAGGHIRINSLFFAKACAETRGAPGKRVRSKSSMNRMSRFFAVMLGASIERHAVGPR